MHKIADTIRLSLFFICAVVMVSCRPAKVEPPTCRLSVETDPPDATVLCDGVSKGAAPLTIADLQPGEHVVSATKRGYNEVRKSVSVAQGQTTSAKLTLEPVLGLVLIHSEPPGCDVQINGADRGKTPLLLTDLPVGRHRVHVNRPGYMPKEVDLDVTDRTPKQIVVNITSDSASLVIDSEPTGAQVMLNGIVKGPTPCTVERIPAGDSSLELTLDGYTPYRQTLKLAAGQKEELKAILKPMPCELTIVSIPPMARIYVENQFRGEAPVTLKDLAPGTYRLRAELKGHEPMARTVEIKQIKQGELQPSEEFRLVRDCGMLELTTEPAGVTVFVDGQQAGVSAPKGGEDEAVSEPLIVDLLAVGTHQVKLTKKGFFPSTFKIDISKEKTATRSVALKRNFVVDYEVRLVNGDTVQGILIEKYGDRSIRMEIKPRIFRTIEDKEIKSQRPLSKPTAKTSDASAQDEPKIAETSPAQVIEIQKQIELLKVNKGASPFLTMQELGGEGLIQLARTAAQGKTEWSLNIAYYPSKEKPAKALAAVGMTLPKTWQEEVFAPEMSTVQYGVPESDLAKLPQFIHDLFVKFFKRPASYRLQFSIEAAELPPMAMLANAGVKVSLGNDKKMDATDPSMDGKVVSFEGIVTSMTQNGQLTEARIGNVDDGMKTSYGIVLDEKGKQLAEVRMTTVNVKGRVEIKNGKNMLVVEEFTKK
jgi:hypothetical protein